MLKCLHCAGEMAPGSLVDSHGVYFRPAETPFFTLTPNKVSLNALMCRSCGRIELRGDTDKLRALLGK